MEAPAPRKASTTLLVTSYNEYSAGGETPFQVTVLKPHALHFLKVHESHAAIAVSCRIFIIQVADSSVANKSASVYTTYPEQIRYLQRLRRGGACSGITCWSLGEGAAVSAGGRRLRKWNRQGFDPRGLRGFWGPVGAAQAGSALEATF